MVIIFVFEIMASKTMIEAKPDQPIRFHRKILIKTNQTGNCLRSLHALLYHGGRGGWQGSLIITSHYAAIIPFRRQGQ
jgi:hypothetical protein